ncbi:hypothetical protein ACFV0Y_16475 [Streptomyces sp. NPDC059569]|uniref:hypothetical protein n=1 Tax=Streptomyces sp. NPDC059569 TaxID=3346869 RepID=UPI0036B4DA52
MTILHPDTAVLSELLCDLPDAPAETRDLVVTPLVRALGLRTVDPDFQASVDAGYVEWPDEWAARVLGEA